MRRRPPRSTRTDTLFSNTTLFRYLGFVRRLQMLSSAPVLLLPPPSEPPVLLVARNIATSMASGEPIPRRQVHTLLTDHFGGTAAEGRWSVRDAHPPLEDRKNGVEGISVSVRVDPGGGQTLKKKKN